MDSQSMKKILGERAALVEECLAALGGEAAVPRRLREAMQYSLMAGGKRLRPVLCLTCMALCGGEMRQALPFAAALEMIHTYSLIHDDLPAMDDDDLRRGRPSCHKAFDEATAILAGDALLTDAFAVIASISLPAERVLCALRTLSEAAGSSGMVGGQMLDMEYTGRSKAISLEELRRMHSMKTGALLRAACVCGAQLAGANEKTAANIAAYGAALGRAFQIADDILDVVADTATLGKPAGSDVALGKMTYPALLGLERSRELAEEEVRLAISALEGFQGAEAAFLVALARYVISRTY